jgi:hypothetical protein
LTSCIGAAVKERTDDPDTSVLGFGPFPSYPSLCQPGKDGAATDNYPFGLCSLKIVDDPGAPGFYDDSGEGECVVHLSGQA